MFCTIYFCLVSRILIASFQNGEIEKARDSIKTPRRMAKWHFSHLMKSSIYLVTCQKTQTSLWGNWRNLESPNFQLEERGIVFHFAIVSKQVSFHIFWLQRNITSSLSTAIFCFLWYNHHRHLFHQAPWFFQLDFPNLLNLIELTTLQLYHITSSFNKHLLME